jgi:hypothetical protein
MLADMVAVWKMAVIIAAIVVLIRLSAPLSLILLGSAAALGLLFGMTPAAMAAGLGQAVVNLDTLKLVVVLELVLLFSAILKEHGSMNRAIAALTRVLRDARITTALIPAVIGLLPMMGGAMLSAPLVAEASDSLGLSAERRTFLNYWFRHVWEYSLPTFSSIFLTASIVGLSVRELVLVNLPLTAVSILAGVVFGFRGVSAPRATPCDVSLRLIWRQLAVFAWNLLPFFLVIGLTLGCGLELFSSLTLVTGATIVLYRLPPRTIGQLARVHVSLELAALIYAIMVFKEILLASDAMGLVSGELTRMGMPAVVLVVLVPATIAFITGYSPAFVGLSFPVLLPMLQAEPAMSHGVMLALASGICAHLLSPTHACYVMTLQYYQASMRKTYRLLLAPALLTFLTSVALYLGAAWR